MAEQSTTVEFRLPSLGSDMEDGTIIEWVVGVGDTVTKGDTLLAVETEKGDIDVETWDSGVITEICAEAGSRVAVGTVIARIETPDAASSSPPPSTTPTPETTPAPSPPTAPPPTAPAPPAPAPPAPSVPPAPSAPAAPPTHGRPSVPPPSPVARVLPAHDTGVTISPRLVYWPTPSTGSGVVRERESVSVRVDDADRVADPMRRAIARTMSRANREIPHYHVQQTIDLDAAQRWLVDRNDDASVAERIVMAALLTKATARAARAVSELNGHWTEEGPRSAAEVNISLIVRRRDGGIVAPVIHRADELDVAETMRCLTDLTTRAKADALTAADLADPTITITNLGDRGVESVLGVIQPPQIALVGFGRSELRPVVVDGSVAPRMAVVATLSGDHRATDGHAGARFLRTLDRALQEPDSL